MIDKLYAVLRDPEDETRQTVIKWWRRLFSGNPAGFYFHLGGPRYVAVPGSPTDEQIIDHLTGQGRGLLSSPVRPDDGTVRFAVDDIDVHKPTDPPIIHAEIAANIARLGLPLVLTRSKRNGAHLWLFFKEKAGFPAEKAQKLMTTYIQLLGLSAHKFEVFPKQSKGGSEYGSGVNLPYRGGERHGVGPGGEEIDLLGYFELAIRQMSYGSILMDRHVSVGGNDSSSAPPSEEYRPMTAGQAQETFRRLLAALSEQTNESRHDRLHKLCWFAARVFTTDPKVFGTELGIKDRIVAAARASSPNDPEWLGRIEKESGDSWQSGIDSLSKEPFKLLYIDPSEDPEVALADLNRKFFVVKNYGNRCRVAWLEEEDYLEELKGRIKMGHQSFQDFKNGLLNEKVCVGYNKKGNPILEPKGEWWLTHPNRRQYWRVVFAPGREVTTDLLNLWQGFAFTPNKGDCSRYLDHLRNIICSGNEDHYKYTLGWMALGVQRPWERGHVGLVWRGDKGPGKNLALDGYGKLFGPHYLVITNAEHLVGRFNAHLRAKLVLGANECFYAGNKQHEASLKGLVTDPMLPIEQKFVDAEADVNLLHLIILSNNDWVVPASDKERRFFMVDVSGEKIGDFSYFRAIQEELEHGGHAALLHYLLNEVDVSDFNVRDVPRTEALRSQMSQSLTGIESVWHECLLRGELPGILDKDRGAWLRGTDLINWASNQKRRDWAGISVEKVGHLFGEDPRAKDKGMGFEKGRTDLFGTGQRNQGWRIPNLVTARETWDKKRFETTWDASGDGWRVVNVNSWKSEPRDA